MRLHSAALPAALLVAAVAVLGLSAPASAADPDVDVSITELPGTLAAGNGAATLTVVASTDERRCRKVRWSMLVAVDGVRLDQVGLDRIEDSGAFPVRVETGDGQARVTDVALDPGRLCRDRTVTARYRIAVDGARDGRVTYQAQAFDAAGRLLQEAGGSSRVVGAEPPPSRTPKPPRSAAPAPSPSPEPSATDPEPSDEPSADDEPPAAAAPADPGAGLDADRAASTGGIPSLFGPGLILGALLVFAGVGLLIRVRKRTGARPHGRRALATHFYPGAEQAPRM